VVVVLSPSSPPSEAAPNRIPLLLLPNTPVVMLRVQSNGSSLDWTAPGAKDAVPLVVVVGIEVVAGALVKVGAGESLLGTELGELVVVFITTGEAVISGAVGPTVEGVG
jgi:hypothetical protein